MASRSYLVWAVPLILTLCSFATSARGQPECPTSLDFHYKVAERDTLSGIAARFYCLDSEPTLTRAWEALYDYNRAGAGASATSVPVGATLCLPRELAGATWTARRCFEGEPAKEPAAAVEVATDVSAPAPTATPVAPAEDGRAACCWGVCDGCPKSHGSSCGVAEAQTGPSRVASETAAKSDVSTSFWKNPLSFRILTVELDAGMGIVMPIDSGIHDRLYRRLGVAELGARLDAGRVVLRPNVKLVWGNHGTLFNENEEQQSLLGGGGALQLGIPLERGELRVTPGIEFGWIYLRREIDIASYPLAGQVEKQSVNAPFGGAYVRPEYKMGDARAFVDAGANLWLAPLLLDGHNYYVNVRILGGVGYVL